MFSVRTAVPITRCQQQFDIDQHPSPGPCTRAARASSRCMVSGGSPQWSRDRADSVKARAAKGRASPVSNTLAVGPRGCLDHSLSIEISLQCRKHSLGKGSAEGGVLIVVRDTPPSFERFRGGEPSAISATARCATGLASSIFAEQRSDAMGGTGRHDLSRHAIAVTLLYSWLRLHILKP